ncbi:MAG: hypothetical protein RL662_6 [Bacteroidota bacterium]|jgi:hypothetical protein
MTKEELLEAIKDLPSNTEILIGDARGDKYGVIHYTSTYMPAEFNDWQSVLDEDKPPYVFVMNTKL